MGDVPEKSTLDAGRRQAASDTSRKRYFKDPSRSQAKTNRLCNRSASLNNQNTAQGDKGTVEIEEKMNFWRWLREAFSPRGTPVFLVAIIAFLLAMLVSIYIRY
jgi:hypothetical protein